MKIDDRGSFVVAANPGELYPLMTNPEFLAKSIPDSKGYKVTDESRFTVTMKVGVSHIRGTMPSHFEVKANGPDQPVRVLVSAQGLGSRVDLSLDFTLEASGAETQVNWESDSTVSGMLASAGAGLLRPLAQRNFNAIVEAIKGSLENAIMEGRKE